MNVGFVIAIVGVIFMLGGCIGTVKPYNNQVVEQEKQRIERTINSNLSTIAVAGSAYLIVDKKILMELIEDARKQDVMLNVASYVYNDVTGTWDRARTLCNKEGDN